MHQIESLFFDIISHHVTSRYVVSCRVLPSSYSFIHPFFCSLTLNSHLNAGLAASLTYGAASELLRRSGEAGQGGERYLMMTEANVNRLVNKLAKMRGAALKLGQFMSIQGMF